MMIVKCNSCNSAFAVDDAKVEKKRFAFTCPKCYFENVIDNRVAAASLTREPAARDESFINPPEQPRADKKIREEAKVGSGKEDALDDMLLSSGEDESSFGSASMSSEDTSASSKTAGIKDSDLDLDSLELPPADDLSSDIPLDDLDIADSELGFDEKKGANEENTALTGAEKKKGDFDNLDDEIGDFKPDVVIKDEMDSMSDFSAGQVLAELEAMDTEDEATDKHKEIIDDLESPDGENSDFSPVDVDVLLGDDIKTEEVYPRDGIEEDESISIDLDSLDLDEEQEAHDLKKEKPLTGTGLHAEEDENITIDLDSLDIDLEEGDAAGARDGRTSGGGPHAEEDENITIDLDSLDIDLEEGDAAGARDGHSSDGGPHAEEDENITIDLDSLDIDLEEGDAAGARDERMPGGGPHAEEDENITIDLDSLDIDLEERDAAGVRDGRTSGGGIDIEEDESISIDLDSLDIDLQEQKESSVGDQFDDLDLDMPDFSAESPAYSGKAPKQESEEDITLDLDTLDIVLDEDAEINPHEGLDSTDTQNLEDAGLTLDELTFDEKPTTMPAHPGISSGTKNKNIMPDNEDIDFSTGNGSIDRELEEAETVLATTSSKKRGHIADEFDDLPDIDLDHDFGLSDTSAAVVPLSLTDDDLVKIDNTGRSSLKQGGLQKEFADVVPRGAINFSIDYSIKYSRIGALIRFVGIFFLGMLPHYVVFLLYYVLSIILGLLNHIVVLTTGRNVEDFSEILENTLRYFLSLSTALIGIVEEMPYFAGRDNIDYPLQMKVIYPLGYSRLLAGLRLSCVGIVLLTLPHILILTLLSPMILVMYLSGLISILINGRWPHILFDFLTRYYRYAARVLAFSIGLIDVYPTFRFD